MRRHDKRGMELAVNTLVVIILGVVIMGGGIALVYKIFDKAKAMPDEVNRQQQDQLFSILLSGKNKIVVLNNVQTVARKESATFPVAIQNQLSFAEATFQPKRAVKAEVVPAGADASCTTPTPSVDKCPTMQLIEDSFIVKRYESKAFYVIIDVPKGAASGEYTFNVDVNTVAPTTTPPPLGLYARTKINVNVQ